MYEKILAAVDQSEIADRVLAATRELASLSGAEVWVIHVQEREPSKFMSSSVESGEEARETVNAAVEKLASAGVKAHGQLARTVYGFAAREIVSFAQENGIGLIVMGSRGHGDLAGLLVGSTAHKVIHLADRPVLVVR
jgi:nucleotide-binding universal stress UspA family protein